MRPPELAPDERPKPPPLELLLPMPLLERGADRVDPPKPPEPLKTLPLERLERDDAPVPGLERSLTMGGLIGSDRELLPRS